MMVETFDPYRKWLGIPPEEQPPNHYRLLGIAPLESDPETIDNAAHRQLLHIRTFQSGKHAVYSQRLLTEVSAARLCLLDGERKAEYDERLRREMADRTLFAGGEQGTPPQAILPPAANPGGSKRAQSRWRTEGLEDRPPHPSPPVPIPMPPPPAPSLAEVSTEIPLFRRGPTAAERARTRRKRSALPVVLTIMSLLIMLVAGGIGLLSANRRAQRPAPVHSTNSHGGSAKTRVNAAARQVAPAPGEHHRTPAKRRHAPVHRTAGA